MSDSDLTYTDMTLTEDYAQLSVRDCYERLMAARHELTNCAFGAWFDSHAALCKAEDALADAIIQATGLTREELGTLEGILS